MKRLTKIDGIGQNDLIRCFDCDEEKAGPNLENCGLCEDGWRKALDRLAAYEDTGLEPEEIKKAFNEEALLKLASQYLKPTPERLRDLLHAEQEGRLVVLPCKVGETVYMTHRVFGNPSISEELFSLSLLEQFGKTVFLTREKAEAALEGGSHE